MMDASVQRSLRTSAERLKGGREAAQISAPICAYGIGRGLNLSKRPERTIRCLVLRTEYSVLCTPYRKLKSEATIVACERDRIAAWHGTKAASLRWWGETNREYHTPYGVLRTTEYYSVPGVPRSVLSVTPPFYETTRVIEYVLRNRQ